MPANIEGSGQMYDHRPIRPILEESDVREFWDEDCEEDSYEARTLVAGGREERADTEAARRKEPAPRRVQAPAEVSWLQKKVRLNSFLGH